jgi:hypothetical protein
VILPLVCKSWCIYYIIKKYILPRSGGKKTEGGGGGNPSSDEKTCWLRLIMSGTCGIPTFLPGE